MKRIYTILLVLFMLLGLTDSFAKGGGGGRSFGGSRSFSSSRSSFSSRPSYSGFSSRPSRSFTFGSSSSSRSTYSRPSTSGSFFSRPSTNRTRSTTIVNNHHYGSSGSHGGGGLGLMDYFMLNSMMNSHDHAPAYAPQPVIVQQPIQSDGVAVAPQSYQSQGTTVVYEEETHYIRNFFLVILGGVALYGLYRLFKYGVGLWRY